jgi:DNA-binding ferritin-like protein
MNKIVKKDATIRPTGSESDFPGTFEVILSAPTLDRDGDTLMTEDWKLPLPEHITFDIDHGMSVASTVGSGVPSIDDETGNLVVSGTYSSLERAQEVRTLVNEGHINRTSVAFMSEKQKTKDGESRTVRELLNGAFVAIPSNREAVILSSKGVAEVESDLELPADPTEEQKTVTNGVQRKYASALCDMLSRTLSDAFNMSMLAHSAHWNVEGIQFAEYHKLFGKIYEDVHGSLDVLAEGLRKLGDYAPATVDQMVANRSVNPIPTDEDPVALAANLYAMNDAVLVSLNATYTLATAMNEQGIANIIAERIDMHQKWSWQLRSSVADENTDSDAGEDYEEMGSGVQSTPDATTKSSPVSDEADSEKVTALAVSIMSAQFIN